MNQLQLIKRQFFALRNGVIADTLRKAGVNHRMIFGLNLPQLSEIAASLPKDIDLARQLWHDTRCRESQMLSPMIWPSDTLSPQEAETLLRQASSTEVADILCQRLLRHTPQAAETAIKCLGQSEAPITRYAALRLIMNLLTISKFNPDEAKRLALIELENGSTYTRAIARQIITEADYMLQPN